MVFLAVRPMKPRKVVGHELPKDLEDTPMMYAENYQLWQNIIQLANKGILWTKHI